MSKMSRITASRLLLGIITSVEAGVTTPEAAVEELKQLKSQAPEGFKADFTIQDFNNIRANYAAAYESSEGDFETSQEDEPTPEPEFEASYGSSY